MDNVGPQFYELTYLTSSPFPVTLKKMNMGQVFYIIWIPLSFFGFSLNWVVNFHHESKDSVPFLRPCLSDQRLEAKCYFSDFMAPPIWHLLPHTFVSGKQHSIGIYFQRKPGADVKSSLTFSVNTAWCSRLHHLAQLTLSASCFTYQESKIFCGGNLLQGKAINLLRFEV